MKTAAAAQPINLPEEKKKPVKKNKTSLKSIDIKGFTGFKIHAGKFIP